MAPTHTPAPKRPTPRKDMIGTTLPPGARELVDALVGTFIGRNRSEVVRFIICSWITEHHTGIKQIAESRRHTNAEAR